MALESAADLKKRSVNATLWSAADIFMRKGLAFIISIVLARLLSPEEFGTIALLYLFTGIASAFVDSGFSASLVQRQDITHTDESTVFWFNLTMGALVALGLWVAAPLIASFYALPILVPLMSALALNVFLSAMGAIHGTLLTKRLDFRTQLKIGAWSTVISGAVAVMMAWYGLGVWALVAHTLVATTVTTLLLWCLNSWRPLAVVSLESVRRLFAFGGYMMASGLLDVAYSRLYTILIGKFFGVRELGFYSRADSTQQLPTGVLTGILSRVAFPIFSSAANDPERLRRGTRLAVRGMMLINVPMMLGLAVVAEPLIVTLFGAQWLPAAPILEVLCIAGVFWPLHVINLSVLMAQGHSSLFFRIELVKKLLGIGLLFLGSLHGVMGIAWSQVIIGAIAFFINAYYTRRYLQYGPLAQIKDFAPALASTLPMVGVVYWLGIQLMLAPALELLAMTALGGFVFLALAWVGRIAALRDVVTLFQKRNPSSPSVQAGT